MKASGRTRAASRSAPSDTKALLAPRLSRASLARVDASEFATQRPAHTHQYQRHLTVPRMDKDLTLSTSRPGRRRRTRRAASGTATGASTRTSAPAHRPIEDELGRARPTPQITDELTLKLAIVLAVSPLNRPPTCHRYANACSCAECTARATNVSRRSADVRQPWHA